MHSEYDREVSNSSTTLKEIKDALRTIRRYGVRKENGTIIVPIHLCPQCHFRNNVEDLKHLRDWLLEIMGGEELVFEYTWHEKFEEIEDLSEWGCGTSVPVENVEWKYMGTKEEQENTWFPS